MGSKSFVLEAWDRRVGRETLAAQVQISTCAMTDRSLKCDRSLKSDTQSKSVLQIAIFGSVDRLAFTP